VAGLPQAGKPHLTYIKRERRRREDSPNQLTYHNLKKRGNMWHNFGEHPTLHHYNYLMSKRHQATLLREPSREYILHQVNETPTALHIYYAWIYRLGWYLENRRQSLMQFGKLHAKKSSRHSAIADLHSLKVLHTEPARRTKWN